MLLSEVGYARPATLEQALGVLAEYPGARALAGGQTLVNVMKARAAAPDVLVDLAGIPELKGIELSGDGTLELGAMTPIFAVLVAPPPVPPPLDEPESPREPQADRASAATASGTPIRTMERWCTDPPGSVGRGGAPRPRRDNRERDAA